MLQLNKINYLKSSNSFEIKEIDVRPILEEVIEKLKLVRPDIEFRIEEIKEENQVLKYKGDKENWEIIFNNILTNFIRYADKEILIKFSKAKIELQNDGERISEDNLDKIFDVYTMGNKGKTGLGLAIVKQTLELFGYSIKAENIDNDNGVRFIICH